jgi:hypothetical protein
LKLFSSRPGIEWKMANYRSFIGTSNFFAANAPQGLIIDYYAKAAGPVRITVTEKSGAQVRQLNARAEAGVINRSLWDLRYESPIPPAAGTTANAVGGEGGRGAGGRGGRGGGGRGGAGGAAAAAETAPAEAGSAPQAEGGGELTTEFGPAGGGGGGGGGGRGFFGAGRGPLVDPGEYTITITAAGKTDSKTFIVEDDPRVQLSSDDRARRRQALSRLVSMTKDAEAGRKKAVGMNTALTSLTDSWKQPNSPPVPDAVKKAAEDLLVRVKAAAAIFESAGGGRGGRGGAGGGAGPPPPYTPPPVTQKIGRVLAALDGYSAAPTTRQMADIEDAAAQLQKGLAEVNRLWDEAPKLNKMMADAGMQYFKVVEATSPPQGGGRGGGK